MSFPYGSEHASAFWIDAICINQADSVERGRQVNIMANIYHQAKEVVIWLGLPDDSTPLAHKTIHNFESDENQQNQCQLQLSTDGRKAESTPGTALGHQQISTAKTDDVTELILGNWYSRKAWRSVVEFFGRCKSRPIEIWEDISEKPCAKPFLTEAWFARSWVVQEFVLARKTIVLCGDISFDWASIGAASHFLATRVSRNMLKSLVGNDFDIGQTFYKSPAKLEAIKRDVLINHTSILLRSLIRCRDYRCNEDKDKIFSLLGIYQVVTGAQLSPNDTLYPNYTLNTTQVYANAAVCILKLETDLTLLTMAEGEDFRALNTKASLPSWVPDWSFGTSKTSIGLGITGYKRFEAAGTRPREIAFSNNNTILRVKAARLDKIEGIGETKEDVGNGQKFDQWLHILGIAASKIRDRESRLDAFWRTLITDTNESGGTPAPPYLKVGFLEWITRKLSNLTEDVRQSAMHALALDTSGEGTVTLEARSDLAAAYELQYAHALHQRLFVTSEGHLGLGSQSMKPLLCETGEYQYSVWIVYGSRVPLVFRHTEGNERYNLVSGAYVHGFMQGEALRRELEFKDIALE